MYCIFTYIGVKHGVVVLVDVRTHAIDGVFGFIVV